MWILLILTSLLVAATDASRVICYYTNWSQYRNGIGKFLPQDVDPNLCTHVMYAFAAPDGLGIRPYEWNDESTTWSHGMYEKMMDLKKQNPKLKVLLAIGGYNAGSTGFTVITRSASSRSTFAQAAVKFLRARDFDGFDIDWEYPADRGSPPQDKQNFVALMQELMRTFQNEAATSGKPRLLLTGAFPAGKDTIDNGFELASLANTMDFINLMTYDFHGGWEQVTGINSPLYAHTKDTGNAANLNLDWVAQYYVSKGVPKSKLNIGMATYGRGFTLDNPSQSDVGAPASQKGTAGRYTGEAGFISYYEICEMIQSGAQVVDVPSQRSKYLLQGRQWVGYDDVTTIREKACYTKQNGFGGIMFWALDLDDFKGQTCGQGRYPLITAAINEMNSPSFANCARKTSSPNTNPNPNPGFGIVNTPRPTTVRPYAPQQPQGGGVPGGAPTGYVPINPPVGGQGQGQPIPANPPTYAPAVTAAPLPSTPRFPAQPPVVTTRAPSGFNGNFAFTLPSNGNLTPRSPSVTFLPGVPTNPPVTNPPVTNPLVTNPPVTYVPAATPGPSATQAPYFDCTTKISDFYPDTSSCDHFYICANHVTYRVQCALGLKYNINTKYCDWAYNVNCQGRFSNPNTGLNPGNNNNNNNNNNNYLPTPAPTLAPKPTTAVPAHTYKLPAPVTSNPNPSNPCAGQQSGFRPDTSDCNKFFQCLNGMTLNGQCPSRLVFNPTTSACDFSLNVPGCP